MGRARGIWMAVMAVLGLLLGGCAIPKEPTFQGISKFQLNGKQNGKEPGFSIGVDVHNPNNYRLKLLQYDLRVTVNGAKVGEAHQRGKQVLFRNSTGTIGFDISTDLKQVLGGLLGVLSGLLGEKKGVLVKVDGTVVAKAKGIRKEVPVTFEKKIEI